LDLSDHWQEKKYVAIGLRLLEVKECEDIWMTLLKLLDDDNGEVKREAGRALGTLKED